MMLQDQSIRVFRPVFQPGRRTCQAGWIVCDTATVIRNGFLETENGVVRSVSGMRPKGPVTDLGPGVVMPALVNAHTHLELSALKDRVPMDMGFEAWVAQLLAKREALGNETLRRAAWNAVHKMFGQGTCVAGEISTLGITRDLLAQLKVPGVWFQEILGSMDLEILDPEILDLPAQGSDNGRRLSSLAGHAPHTTGPDKLVQIKQMTRIHGRVFSIHLAESAAESEFINTGKGAWADFLAARGIDTAGWPVGNTTPVAYLNRLGILDHTTLAVHLIRAGQKDLELISQTGASVCVCPRSNDNLHQRLPDIESMLNKGIPLALGTDSLASCPSLSIFDEMAFIRRQYPDIRPDTLFDMATAGGAGALGLDRFYGCLAPGRQALFAYADLDASCKHQIFERLTFNEI